MEPATNPPSDCEVRDPRIRRTRQLLQGALRSLMATKSFDEISVQDIAEVSTINRATFYDHYTDKYALLEATVASGFYQLLNERNVQYEGSCPSAAAAIILATCNYLEMAHRGGNCSRQSAFEPLIEAAITTAIRRVLAPGIGRHTASPDALALPSEIIATATSWAIYGAVKEWFSLPNHCPADEIVPKILRLILPILMGSGAQKLDFVHAELGAVPRS